MSTLLAAGLMLTPHPFPRHPVPQTRLQPLTRSGLTIPQGPILPVSPLEKHCVSELGLACLLFSS